MKDSKKMELARSLSVEAFANKHTKLEADLKKLKALFPYKIFKIADGRIHDIASCTCELCMEF